MDASSTSDEAAFGGRMAFPWAVALGAIGVAVFFAGVYAYAIRGEAFVIGLDRRMGEILARRAESLAASGDVDTALAAYSKALAAPFEHAGQRTMWQREYGRLLLAQGQYTEALAQLDSAGRAAPADLKVRALLCELYRQSAQYDLLEDAARNWLTLAQAAGSGVNISQAQYHLGLAYENTGKLDDALAAYARGHEADALGVNAYHEAELLIRLGRRDEALPLLESYVKIGEGVRLANARQRLDGLRK